MTQCSDLTRALREAEVVEGGLVEEVGRVPIAPLLADDGFRVISPDVVWVQDQKLDVPRALIEVYTE
jgi:hypothetical protein